jgi:hypothetical protein
MFAEPKPERGDCPPGEVLEADPTEDRPLRVGRQTLVVVSRGGGRESCRIAVGGWMVIPFMGGSSRGTTEGRSSLVGGVPLLKV